MDARELEPGEFEQWNDRLARKFNPDDFHRKSSGLVGFVNRMRVRSVLKLLDANDGHRVLEIGCGAGNVLAQVPSRERSGVDLSDFLLEIARRNCGPGVNLVKGNAERLPFNDEAFDRVYCTEVIEHVQDPEKVVEELARVLRPGGRAVVSLPNDRTIGFAKKVLRKVGLFGTLLGSRGKGAYEPPDENEWHISSMTLRNLRAIMGPRFREHRVAYIPTRLFPIQYVLAFTKPAIEVRKLDAA